MSIIIFVYVLRLHFTILQCIIQFNRFNVIYTMSNMKNRKNPIIIRFKRRVVKQQRLSLYLRTRKGYHLKRCIIFNLIMSKRKINDFFALVINKKQTNDSDSILSQKSK